LEPSSWLILCIPYDGTLLVLLLPALVNQQTFAVHHHHNHHQGFSSRWTKNQLVLSSHPLAPVALPRGRREAPPSAAASPKTVGCRALLGHPEAPTLQQHPLQRKTSFDFFAARPGIRPGLRMRPATPLRLALAERLIGSQQPAPAAPLRPSGWLAQAQAQSRRRRMCAR